MSLYKDGTNGPALPEEPASTIPAGLWLGISTCGPASCESRGSESDPWTLWSEPVVKFKVPDEYEVLSVQMRWHWVSVAEVGLLWGTTASEPMLNPPRVPEGSGSKSC